MIFDITKTIVNKVNFFTTIKCTIAYGWFQFERPGGAGRDHFWKSVGMSGGGVGADDTPTI